MSKVFFKTSAILTLFALNFSLQADEPSPYVSARREEQTLSPKDKALLYLICGYTSLNSNHYQDALEDYQKASNISPEVDNLGIDFLISFGSIIACDHLHLSESIQLHAENIRNIIHNDLQGKEHAQESVFQGNEEVIEHLRFFAHTSASETTQNLLLSFISEIFPSEPTLPLFSRYAHSQTSEISDSHQEKAPFCQKSEKLAGRISRAWGKIDKRATRK